MIWTTAGSQRCREQGKNGSRTKSDVFASAKHCVHEAPHEGGVETVLRRQARYARVGQRLRDHHQPHSESCNDVRHQPAGLVAEKPLEEWKLIEQKAALEIAREALSQLVPVVGEGRVGSRALWQPAAALSAA